MKEGTLHKAPNDMGLHLSLSLSTPTPQRPVSDASDPLYPFSPRLSLSLSFLSHGTLNTHNHHYTTTITREPARAPPRLSQQHAHIMTTQEHIRTHALTAFVSLREHFLHKSEISRRLTPTTTASQEAASASGLESAAEDHADPPNRPPPPFARHAL